MKTKIKLFLILCFASLTLLAQETKKVSGTVTDEATGEALIGVSVVEAGTTNGVITGLDGNFEIAIAGNVLNFSYVGYSQQAIRVNGNEVLNVKMKSSAELDEVVVVGYGVQKKSDLTGAISSISGKDLQNQGASNVSNLLAGKASGVSVSASSGQPGATAVVRVRGLGTVNDNNPLYVVDGQFMDNINNVNPADIERIEILKDASALAIYGSRGSNGVIIVSTKAGKSGELAINFDMSLGVKNSYKALNMMNSDQYYDFIMTSKEADGWKKDATSGDPYKFTQQYKRGYNTDWWDAATQTAFTQNYNLSIRKGTDNSRTAFSVGYLGDEGPIITTEFNRLSLRLSQEYDIKDIVTVGATINIAKIKQRDSKQLSSFDNIQKADPFTPVINPLVDPSSENYKYDKYAPTEWSFKNNPVADLKIPSKYDDEFNAFGNVFANVKLFKGLSYRFQYSFERNDDKFHNFTPYYVNTFTDYIITDKAGKETNKRSSLEEKETRIFNQTFENRLNYNTQIGKHSLDLMAAITYETRDKDWFSAYGAGAIGNEEDYEVIGAHPESHKADGIRISTSMMSYLGRLNYSYDNKYLFTANFRADGSSVFTKDNRWGYFPSVSLGWRITNEKFFQDLKADNWSDDMKIRVGWGRNGNARIDQNSPLTLVGTGINDKWNFGGNTIEKDFLQGYYLSYTGNRNVKWEISEQVNVGLDATLFNKLSHTLSVSMDYYVKTTRDVLLPFELPSFGGYTNNPYMNAGKVQNTGFDISLNYANSVNRDFSFNAGVNLSTYKTNVKSLSIGEYELDYLSGSNGRSYLGGGFNRFWGYKQIGIFQNQAEIDNYVDAHGNKIQEHAKPGDFKFANLDNDNPLGDSDRTFIGDPNPDLIYGFNLGFNYKNFDLSMSFQGTVGNDIWNSAKGGLASAGYQNALEEAYTKAWRTEGDKAKYPKMGSASDNFVASSFYVEDGSYMRLQNLQIGYNIPKDLCAKTKMFSSLRVFASAQNLFTITGYSGLDPELGINKTLDLGVDNTRYPSARTFIFGLNVQF